MRSKHPALRLLILSGFAFLLGFSYNYHLPKLEAFLLNEVERLSSKHLPLRIYAENLRFRLIPLSVVLEDVHVIPKAPLNRYLAPARLKEAGGRLSFLSLLRGDVRLSSIFIRDSELNLFLKPELFEGSSGAKRPSLDFNEIYRLPIDEVSLERVQLQGKLEPQNLVFRLSNLNLVVENRYRSLLVELAAPEVLVKPSGPLKPLTAQVELRTLVEAHEMQFSAIKIKADESFLVASGHFSGDIAEGKFKTGAFDARAKVQLPDLNRWEHAFCMNPKLPDLVGRAEADLNLEIDRQQAYKIDADIGTENLQIDKFKIGSIKGKLNSDLQRITSEALQFQNDAGRVRVSGLDVQLEGTQKAAAKIAVDGLEIHQLLENLNVKGVPILLPIKGETACQGVWGDKPELNCKGKLESPHLRVSNDVGKASTIIDTNDLNLNGDVKVTLKDVEYNADLKIGKESRGRSRGKIDYDTGFKIFYDGDNVAFGDVKAIAGLKVEGSAKISGQTEGTSDWATIAMYVEGKDLWLEDYPLGRASTAMTYKQGQMTFANVQGQYGSSQYNGQVGVDLLHDQLDIKGTIPFADLHDLQLIFGRKLTLPFQVSGTGQGQIEAHGPFRFQDLSYKLRSSFFRGELAGETFDELVFDVTSKDGLVKSDKITLNKSSGGAEAKGQITPQGQIDMVVVGRSMRLEQSESVMKLGFDLQGLADFTVLVRGQLPRPRIELNGRLSRVVLADESAQDSVFKINFLPDRLEGSGQFLGSTLLADLTYPYTGEAPFLLRMKARQWDFTTLFSLVSKSARQMDFATSLSGTVNLASPRGGFWASTGSVQIDEFSLRKGMKSMQATQPMRLNFRGGEVNSSGCTITSGDSYLKLDVAGLTRDKLNASLNGKLDLSLLGLFTPFISDLRGNMALSMDLSGSATKPVLSGSAYVEKGYAKFADFAHPFINTRADVLFNDNQIVINSLKADMAGGKLAGDGRVTFAGGGSRPIEARATFAEVKLNVPEGYHTQGNGSVTITGKEFPYTMGIIYNVTGGEVTAEFGEDTSSTTTIKASSYLPRFLYQDAFHPFTFNVDVALKSPITVNNALANTQVSGRLSVNGTPDKLLFNGTLTPLPGGKVFFSDTPFEISSAFIEYTDNPPANPKIYLTATTRKTEMSQDENQRATERQYDVNLIAQGRGPVPQILLSSQPPLSQREIVSLLALGITTGTAETRRANDTDASSTSAALGAAILQKAGGKRIKESLGVDVKVSSSQPTPDAASSPKVTFSKQFTPKLGASASSTLQANPANSVRLEYKINKSMSAIGSWEGREYVREQTNPALNVLGLDLEYKKQFK